MNLPDYLVGLGGAGREIVRRFMEEEWIIEQAVGGDGLQAYFIETDTNADPEDDEGAVDATVEKVAAGNGYTGVDGTHINLIEGVSQRPRNTRLLSDTIVRNIAREEPIDAWWLEDDTDLVCEDSNYADGVVRRRGLTKALYHYSRADNQDPIGDLYNAFPQDSYGAFVVGLGGGTGSGLFLDLAKNLEESVDLTLFGVLPHPTESDAAELANAYAALCELEYQVLEDDNPFTNIVLIPSEPYTNYDEFDEAIVYTIASYYNLEKAMGNIAARFDETVASGPAKFAPFTVAVPQVVTYPGGQRDEIKATFRKFLEDRRETLESEEELLESAEAFIATYYDDVSNALLDETGSADSRLEPELYGDTGLHVGRLTPVKELLEADFHQHWNYETVEEILQIWGQIEANVADGEGVQTSAERESLIEDLAEQDLDADVGSAYEDLEVDLVDFADRELTAIGRRAGLRKAFKELDDAAVVSELSGALEYEIGGVVSNAGDVVDHLEDIRNETGSFRDDVASIRTAAEASRDRSLQRWNDRYGSTVSEFVQLEAEDDAVRGLLDDLEGALEEFANAAEEWSSDGEAENAVFEFDDFDELNRSLEEIGVEPIDGTTITDSVAGVRTAGKAKLDDGGLLDGFLGGDDPEDEYAYQRNHEISRDVFDIPRFHESEGFECDARRDLLVEKRAELDERRESLRTTLVESVRNALPDEVDDRADRDEIVSRLEETVDGFDAVLEDRTAQLRDDLDSDIEADPLEATGVDVSRRPERIDTDEFDPRRHESRIEAALDEIAETAGSGGADVRDATERLDNLLGDALIVALIDPTTTVEDVFEAFEAELVAAREKFETLQDVVSAGSAFESDWEGPIDVSEIQSQAGSASTTPESGSYVTTIMPDQPGRLENETIGETDIWGEEPEREILLGELQRRAVSAFSDSAYLPLNRKRIDDHGANFARPDYTDHLLHTTYMSRAFDPEIVQEADAHIGEVADRIDEYAPDYDDFSATRCGFADEWDFAMVTFVGGIFLDNLKPVPNEFRGGYDSVAGKKIPIDGDEDRTIDSAVIRHAYGIDGQLDDVPDGADGAFIRRDEFIRLNQPDSLRSLLDHSGGEDDSGQYVNEVVEELRSRYVGRVGFPSTRPTE